uniref:G-protein coupled receptors family 1 profile domain-containing protein n=1 Tax=Romanomermis culicivorax TaxID=13658 RepID=A0A915HFB1_ROMCU
MFTLVVMLSILYIILGSIGMTVNLCVTLLICFSSKFKNPTYTYIVNHLASDMLCLFPISIYTGFCMLIGEKYLERLMSVLVDL